MELDPVADAPVRQELMKKQHSRFVTPDNQPVPDCMVLFQCQRCGAYHEHDVFRSWGLLACKGDKENPHPEMFMAPLQITRDYRKDPRYGYKA